MKTLASCKPTEFLAQTVRIKDLAEKLIKEAGIREIRSEKPAYKPFPPNISEEERSAIAIENGKILQKHTMEKGSRLFDAVARDNAEKALALLALCCFVEPDNVDDYPMGEYLNSISELMGDKAVISFFTSLAQWVQRDT